MHFEVLDPSGPEKKETFKVKGTKGIECDLNAIKVAETIENMHMKYDLKLLDQKSKEIMSIEEKDRLMKHTTTFINELWASVTKIIHH